MAKFSVSERFACKVLGQHRSTQRKAAKAGPMKRGVDLRHHPARFPLWPLWLSQDHGDAAVTRRLTVNAKRVERIWRREG